jgi:transposase InsO family protein
MTKATFDSIWVVTDRLTKYGYFVPYNKSSDATDLAYAFMKIVVSQHGLPDEIISDRDKLFTSKFWKSLMVQLGANHKLSTAFHPQTDGQTERLNARAIFTQLCERATDQLGRTTTIGPVCI